ARRLDLAVFQGRLGCDLHERVRPTTRRRPRWRLEAVPMGGEWEHEMSATPYVAHQTEEAAFIMTRGHELLEVQRVNDGECHFLFPAEAAADADAFMRNASAPARPFSEALTRLKRLIAAAKGTPAIKSTLPEVPNVQRRHH